MPLGKLATLFKLIPLVPPWLPKPNLPKAIEAPVPVFIEAYAVEVKTPFIVTADDPLAEPIV